jgi:hypothetical protein
VSQAGRDIAVAPDRAIKHISKQLCAFIRDDFQQGAVSFHLTQSDCI